MARRKRAAHGATTGTGAGTAAGGEPSFIVLAEPAVVSSTAAGVP